MMRVLVAFVSVTEVCPVALMSDMVAPVPPSSTSKIGCDVKDAALVMWVCKMSVPGPPANDVNGKPVIFKAPWLDPFSLSCTMPVTKQVSPILV